MQGDEKLVVMMDGVDCHINQSSDEFKELRQAGVEFLKGAANSSSVLQVCDLLQMFHNIKVPEKYQNKLTKPLWYVYINKYY